MDQIDFQKELANAKKNYILAVRWLKEAIAYKALMAGSEWIEDGKELIADADAAYEEAKFDVLFWRGKLTTLQKSMKRGKSG
jgi:hypothetical protein